VRLTHIINPVAARADSHLAKTQTLCLRTIELALAHARTAAPHLEVDVVCAIFPEDAGAVPGYCRATGTLMHSLRDQLPGANPATRKLPLIGEIYQLGHALGAGTHLIYTNIDICPQPYFYPLIARLLQDAPAFGIPRRNIAPEPIALADLTLMQAQVGSRHQGMDTFVCPRDYVPRFNLESVCIGLPTVEYALLGQIDALSGFQAKLYKHLLANFHHGDDRIWQSDDVACAFNDQQTTKVLARLKAEYPAYPAHSLFDWFSAKFSGQRPKAKGLAGKLRDALRLRPRHPEPFDITSGE